MNIATSQHSPQIGMPPASIDGVSQQEINAAVRAQTVKSQTKKTASTVTTQKSRQQISIELAIQLMDRRLRCVINSLQQECDRDVEGHLSASDVLNIAKVGHRELSAMTKKRYLQFSAFETDFEVIYSLIRALRRMYPNVQGTSQGLMDGLHEGWLSMIEIVELAGGAE
ncbi:hypothetical protein ACMSSJ_13790 [Kerstersia gyiorum]|uniref:hypothetical protein n=1 Tax=Kerstersia gyiorum TaxID=206506 RepID=UPI0039EA42DE